MTEQVWRGRGLLQHGAVGTQIPEEDHRAAFARQRYRERTDDVLVVAPRIAHVVGDRRAVDRERPAVEEREQLLGHHGQADMHDSASQSSSSDSRPARRSAQRRQASVPEPSSSARHLPRSMG